MKKHIDELEKRIALLKESIQDITMHPEHEVFKHIENHAEYIKKTKQDIVELEHLKRTFEQQPERKRMFEMLERNFKKK